MADAVVIVREVNATVMIGTVMVQGQPQQYNYGPLVAHLLTEEKYLRDRLREADWGRLLVEHVAILEAVHNEITSHVINPDLVQFYSAHGAWERTLQPQPA